MPSIRTRFVSSPFSVQNGSGRLLGGVLAALACHLCAGGGLGPAFGQVARAGEPGALVERSLLRLPAIAGRSVSVSLARGEIRVEGRDAQSVEIAASGPSTVSAEGMAVEHDDRTIRVTSAPGLPDVSATVVVRLPRRSPITIQLGSGTLHLSGLDADVTARVQRGRIDGQGLGGAVNLETGTGDIHVTHLRLAPGVNSRMRTFAGHVRLRFAQPPANGRVLALTLSGKVESSIPLTRRAGTTIHEGVWGEGSGTLSLDVVRGDISIGY